MLRVTLRNLVAHKLRLFTTGLAVMLGVAFMAGTLVLGDTMQRTFDALFADVYKTTDALVRAKASFKDPNTQWEQRGRIDASLLDTVRGVDGVAAAQGDVFAYAQLVDKAGEPIGNPSAGPPTVGANWPDVARLNPWILAAGRAPAADDEVVVDKKTADGAGYRVGDRAKVLVQGPPRDVRIVGIARLGKADSPGGAQFVIFTTSAAQRFVGQPGKFDSVSVAARPGVSQAEVVRRIERALPAGIEAVTGKVVTKENQDAMKRALSVFSRFMLVFAVVALLVGGFMIFNTFFITVAQRTRENALMRAIGASRRQVLTSVLLEALGIGIVASCLGLIGGVAVAAGLKALLTAFGMELPAGGIVFTPTTAVFSLAAGIGITVIAAVSPARKAGKIPPVAAMSDVPPGSTGYGSKERIFVGAGILALGVASLFYGLFGGSDNALAVVGLGVLLVFFGISVLGRTVALPLSRVIGAPLPRLRGITGALARENAMRNPRRTAATASALMIGVGLVGFITIFAASTKASFGAIVDKAFLGDFVITSRAAAGSGGLDPALADRLDRLPEVDVAAGIRAGLAQVEGSPKQILGVDPRAATKLFDVGPVAGSPDDLDAGAIAVQRDVAKAKGLHVGDKVPVVFRDTGRRELTVRLVYREKQPAGDWFLGRAAYEANFADQYDFQVFVKKAGGVSAATALTAVKREAATTPGAKVLDQTQYKADQTKFIDQMLGLVYALLALAILIALLGIGNTLALSILERRRELGVLRAVGMTRGQLRSTIRWESVIIALQGTLLGLVVGVFYGWALVAALHDEGISVFRLPTVSLAVVVLLGGLSGVLAAVLPARRAARLDVLKAVVTE